MIINTNAKRFLLLLSVLIFSIVTFSLNLKSFSERERNIFSALTDRSAYRCGKVFRILNPLKDVCQIGAGGFENNILLVGDSHADSIKTIFSNEANARGIGVFFYVDNDPLLHEGISAKKIVADAIRLNTESIILHFNFNMYKEEKFREQLLQLESLTHKQSLNLSIIAPIPTYNVVVPKAIYGLNGEEYSDDLILTKKEHYQTISEFSKIADKLRRQSVMIIDPVKSLCPDSCRIMNEEFKPFYFDSHHLTLTGSRELKGIISDLLDSLNLEKE